MFIAAVVIETYFLIKIMQSISPKYSFRKWSETDKITEENLSQKLHLVLVAKNEDPSTRVKMHETLFLFLPLFSLYLLNGCNLFYMSCLS